MTSTGSASAESAFNLYLNLYLQTVTIYMEFYPLGCYSLYEGILRALDFNMATQRIILINGSRLLGDMLHNVIYRTAHLETVQEVGSHEELPSAIESSDAEWMVMSLPYDKSIPEWVDRYIAKHPSMRFLAVFIGSNKVKIKWLESHEQDLEDLSLNDLIHILESHPQQA